MRHQSTDFLLPSIVSQVIELYRHPVYAAVTLFIIQEVLSLYLRQGCTALGAPSLSVILL